MTRKLLGSVGEARDKVGLEDTAEVWEWVAAGWFEATHEDDDNPNRWTIWDVR